VVKHGVEIPWNVSHGNELDALHGNTLWHNAIKKEISSLLDLNCFKLHAPGYKSSLDFHFAPLTIIFDVKQCGHCNTQLVAGAMWLILAALILNLQW